VAKEQYLQWQRHVRESESVTLREYVTRRIHWHHTGVRFWAIFLLAVVLAGCGGERSTGSFGDVTVALDSAPDANDVGVFLAQARGYDEAEGVTFKLGDASRADLRLVSDAALRGSPDLVGVMAIVQPAKLVLAVRRETLQEDRGMVAASVRALQRGYQQAQIEPDEAVQAMASEVPDLDATAISAQLDRVAPTWSAGAPFIGALPAGSEFDRSIARYQPPNQ
jgi:ABC-type nitrate/sulfonate/bicarbonate transport system substrate-binding protein